MLIETNGYVVMNKKEMSFLTREEEFSDDINDAEVYTEYAEAKQDVDSLNVDEPNKYEVIKYSKTLWLEQPDEETETFIDDYNTLNYCDKKYCHQDISVFGEQMEIGDLMEVDNGEDIDE